MRAAGFALIEALIATTVVTVAVGTLSALIVSSERANAGAGTTTTATILAAEKLEQLRALAWTTDAAGDALSDTTTDTAAVPEQPMGGTGLNASPADALAADVAGFVDYLDADAKSLGGGSPPPSAARYVRRWAITPLPSDPANTLVFQVVVSTIVRSSMPWRAGARLAGQARLVAVRARSSG
jgi:hypothetical protein